MDIEVATTLACAMHGSLGLAGPNPLVYLGPGHRAHEFLRFADVRKAVPVELADAERVCGETRQRLCSSTSQPVLRSRW